MRSILNLARRQIRFPAQSIRSPLTTSSIQQSTPDVVASDTSNSSLNQTIESPKSPLSKLNSYIANYKFVKAIQEVRKLVKLRVENIPSQELFGKLARNGSILVANNLFEILSNAHQQYPISDISYAYLIDSTLQFQDSISERDIRAHNLAIHAYLSNVVLDIETYRGIFAASSDMDPSFRRCLYDMYKRDFKLNSQVLYDLLIQAQGLQDYEMVELLEAEAAAQGIPISMKLRRLMSRAQFTFNVPSQNQQETLLEFLESEATQPAATNESNEATQTNSNPQTAESLSQEEGTQEMNVPPLNHPQTSNNTINNENPTQEQEQPTELNQQQLFNTQSSYQNLQSIDKCGNDILKLLKKAQKKGILNTRQAPVIFVVNEDPRYLQTEQDEEDDDDDEEGFSDGQGHEEGEEDDDDDNHNRSR